MQAFALLVFAAVAYAAPGIPSPQIIGGKNAPPGKYPYQVSMQIRGMHWCGASIIDQYNILTAAHCTTGLPVAPTVKAGTNNMKVGGSVHEVEAIIIHGNYNHTSESNDVAILYLRTPLKFSQLIKPSKLATDDSLIREGKTCVVAGWGDLGPDGSRSDILQEIETKVYSQEKCEREISFVTGKKMCAINQKGIGVCGGDSGGPLAIDGVQVGIVCQSICGSEYPAVYTRVSHYLSWINTNLKK